MRDDWHGHRDPFTGDRVGDRDEWIEWDHLLADTYQLIEDYTDPKSGLLIWEIEDEDVVVDAHAKVNKFQEAIDEKTNMKNYKPANGQYFVPHMYSRRKDENGVRQYQTFREWLAKEVEKATEEG